MLKFKESLIAANHNYLVNEMLTPGFVLGHPEARDEFWFVADVVGPGRREGLISARLYDGLGNCIVEMKENEITENPGQILFQPIPEGFRLNEPSGKLLMESRTRSFTNGTLTLIHAKLYDKQGGLRMEPSYEGVKVYGEGRLALPAPYRFR